MKKIGIGILSASIIALSMFAGTKDELKQDISKIFTNGKLKKSSISIIAQGSAKDLKNLHVLIGTIKGNPKPFLLLYNKDTMIVGSIKNRKNGKSIFIDFINKNKDKIQKALSKIQKKETGKEIKNNKKLISLFNGKYKDSMFRIRGGNPNGKIIYLITDPNCPYCKQYEENELPKAIKNLKEVRVIPLFLNIPGHETSPMRSSWLLERAKNDKNPNMLSLMHKASNEKDDTYKEVDSKFAKKAIARMKGILATGLIKGTPTMFDASGNPTR